MAIFLNVLLVVAIIFVGLFALSLIVYFFNLDMKLTTALEPLLQRLYNRRKRNRKI